MQQEVNKIPNKQIPLNSRQREEVKHIIQTYSRGQSFTDRKLTDTPTDANQVVPRRYVNLNGLVANRPNSSVATTGQHYLATDTGIPMVYNAPNWVNGVGSVVATG